MRETEGVQGSSGGPFAPPPPPDACPTPQSLQGGSETIAKAYRYPRVTRGTSPPQSPPPGSMLGRAGTGQQPKHTLGGGRGRGPTAPPGLSHPEHPPQQDWPPQSHHQLVPWEARGGHLGSGVPLGPARRQHGRDSAPQDGATCVTEGLWFRKVSLYGTRTSADVPGCARARKPLWGVPGRRDVAAWLGGGQGEGCGAGLNTGPPRGDSRCWEVGRRHGEQRGPSPGEPSRSLLPELWPPRAQATRRCHPPRAPWFARPGPRALSAERLGRWSGLMSRRVVHLWGGCPGGSATLGEGSPRSVERGAFPGRAPADWFWGSRSSSFSATHW